LMIALAEDSPSCSETPSPETNLRSSSPCIWYQGTQSTQPCLIVQETQWFEVSVSPDTNLPAGDQRPGLQ
jgi:hypothetical protein